MADSSIARARSFLFVPASRPERTAKALDSGAGDRARQLIDAQRARAWRMVDLPVIRLAERTPRQSHAW